MTIPYLELGEPPWNDPPVAAELWRRYLKRSNGKPPQETAAMFFRMVESPKAVMAELERSAK
jgi:hypothetical protein